jgi:PEP-CTERM motif
MRILKTVFAALAVATAMPASATIIHAVGDDINYESGNYYGGIRFEDGMTNFYEVGPAGRFLFNGTDTGTNAPFSALTFCADIFHGVGTDDYLISPLSSIATSAVRQKQLAALLTYADATINLTTDYLVRNATAAALQLAMWEVIYEGDGIPYTVRSGNFSTDFYFTDLWDEADSYLANITDNTWKASASQGRVLLAANMSQSQLYAVSGGVPEPATWLTMMLGFIGIGVGTRASRPRRAVKTA